MFSYDYIVSQFIETCVGGLIFVKEASLREFLNFIAFKIVVELS